MLGQRGQPCRCGRVSFPSRAAAPAACWQTGSGRSPGHGCAGNVRSGARHAAPC